MKAVTCLFLSTNCHQTTFSPVSPRTVYSSAEKRDIFPLIPRLRWGFTWENRQTDRSLTGCPCSHSPALRLLLAETASSSTAYFKGLEAGARLHTHCTYAGNLRVCFSITCLECVAAVKTAVRTQPPAPECIISHQCCLLSGIKSIFSKLETGFSPKLYYQHAEHPVCKWLQVSYKRFYAHSCHCTKQMLVKPYQNCAHGCLLVFSILIA